jgi:hypothetical protein
MEAKRKARRLLLALVMLVTAVLEGKVLVGQAHAIIGRPLTPMSYAGVARRTTRRTVAAGVAVGAAAATTYQPYPYQPYPAYW